MELVEEYPRPFFHCTKNPFPKPQYISSSGPKEIKTPTTNPQDFHFSNADFVKIQSNPQPKTHPLQTRPKQIQPMMCDNSVVTTNPRGYK